jgi:two-component system OmpR family response regulator
VERGGRTIELTAREFDFLLCLARNAGRVVSRAELLAEVWDDAGTTHSNVIDVYASRLRRKIDEGEAAPLVLTRRGVGYMIDAPSSRSGPETETDPAPVGD